MDQRLGKIVQCTVQALGSALVPLEPALQIKLVGKLSFRLGDRRSSRHRIAEKEDAAATAQDEEEQRSRNSQQRRQKQGDGNAPESARRFMRRGPCRCRGLSLVGQGGFRFGFLRHAFLFTDFNFQRPGRDQPFIQFRRVSVDGGSAPAGHSVDGQAPIRLPSLDGPFPLAQITGNLLPTVQALPKANSVFRVSGRRLHKLASNFL